MNPDQSELKKKIAARIKALLAKTTEAGCTEDEAFAAMQKSRELMDRYGLSDNELRHQAETIGETKTERKRFRHIIIKDRLAYQVARYCDCKSWHSSYFGTHTFYGPEADREFATWLLDSLEQFVRRQTVDYMESGGYANGAGPWDAQKGFILGCIERINSQLAEMTRARQRDRKTGDGRPLAVVKMALVEAAFRQATYAYGVHPVRGSATAITARMPRVTLLATAPISRGQSIPATALG